MTTIVYVTIGVGRRARVVLADSRPRLRSLYRVPSSCPCMVLTVGQRLVINPYVLELSYCGSLDSVRRHIASSPLRSPLLCTVSLCV